MNNAILIVLLTSAVIVWMAVGIAGYVFWWTSQFNLESDDVFFAVFTGACLGPFAWPVGYFIHKPRSARVVMRQRKSGDS